MKYKAIFLDRDGVINEDIHNYTWEIENFRILPGVFEALNEFIRKGYLLIIITNQGGIAKGLYTKADVENLHTHLRKILSLEGIELTEIYYCPHHEINGKCLCRKPGSLLVEKAVARFDIDPALSYFIGDRERDIIAGEGAGIKGILVAVNSDLRSIVQQIK